MKGFHIFFGAIAILSVITLCNPVLEPDKLGTIPEPKPVPSRLTNIPFTPTTAQRELIAMFNGMEVKPGLYTLVSPASAEETAQVCSEMQFSLPLFVECEGRMVRFDVSDYVRGTIVMHSWLRRPRAGQVQAQEFLEVGLLLTECGQDLCMPLDRDMKLTTPVEREDHRPGVAQ